MSYVTGRLIDPESSTGRERLTIIKTATLAVVKTIPLGWRVYRLSISKDGLRLAALSTGRSGEKDRPEEQPVATVVDTTSNEVVATHRIAGRDVQYKVNKNVTMPLVDMLNSSTCRNCTSTTPASEVGRKSPCPLR